MTAAVTVAVVAAVVVSKLFEAARALRVKSRKLEAALRGKASRLEASSYRARG